MAKKKSTIFYCTECGNELKNWVGQCPMCHSWNTIIEKENVEINSISGIAISASNKIPKSIDKIENKSYTRFKTDINEFDSLLGGGIVEGSLSLIGGAPGIGKSTLLLQICKSFGDQGKKVLYVSGEENLSQIKMRAERIGDFTNNVLFLDDVNLPSIISIIDKEKPDFLVIDSIQTMNDGSSEQVAGSINQVRICAQILFRIAKERNITTFIIGHVTKDGQVAGPKILEHLVDTVLYFEDDMNQNLRLLRCYKNRFGKDTSLAVFSMEKNGLREIANPSEIFLDSSHNEKIGSCITCIVDSGRPILVEVQSLVTKSGLGMARRNINGGDYNKLAMLIAIIEKRLNIPLYEYDIFVNITGGLKIKDTSIDLAIIMAIISSYKNKSLGSDCIYAGEVGLSGEVRSINNAQTRIDEAMKLGYKRIFLPKTNVDKINKEDYKNISVIAVSDIIK